MKLQTHLAGLAGMAAMLMAAPGFAALQTYSQNFNSLTQSDPAALSNVGWTGAGLVFANPPETFKFFYGNFPAPNGGPGFSAVALGEGQAGPSDQYINVYSDYNCCSPGEGHQNGTDIVESRVFQEQLIGVQDVGSTWAFQFDVKAPSSLGCGTSAAAVTGFLAKCQAFIRTLDPNNNFNTTNLITYNSTNANNSAWSTQVLSLVINPSLAGQILQFGFDSRSSNYQNTGVYYDNISFSVVPVPAAVWLFGGALAVLGGVRRRSVA
jgi:hypothetical protein